MRISFRTKIVAGVVGILAVFLSVLIASNLKLLVSSHERELNYQAEAIMDFLAASIRQEMQMQDQAGIERIVDSALQSVEVLAVRVSNVNEIIIEREKNNYVADRTKAIRVVRSVEAGANQLGIIELTIDAEHLDEITQRARQQSIKIAMVEILLVSIAAFALAAYLTDRLAKLTAALGDLEQGVQTLTINPNVLPNDEIGDTYRALIHLQEALTTTQNQHDELLSQTSQLAHENSQKEDWLKAIINQLTEGVIAFDEQGTIHYTNMPAQNILGYEGASLKGLTIFDLSLSDVQQGRIRAFINNSPQDRSRETLTRHGNELIYHRDGSAVSASVSLSYTRIEQTDYFILSVAEMSLRKQVERQMKIGDAVRTGILESSLSAIIAIDQDDNILEFNPSAEKIFGYSRQAVMSKRMSDLIMPERFREAHRMGMKKFLASGEGPVLSKRIEILAINSDQKEFPIELAITPISTDDGHIFTAVIDDISQRIKDTERLTAAKEEADRSSQEKSRFLASMSHEIRTPLNIMLGMVDLLQGTQLNEQQKHFIVSAENSGRNLLDMINDVLDLSKIEAGKMEPNNAYFDPVAVFEETTMLFSQRCWSKGLRLYLFVGGEIPEAIFSDVAFFRQIISNLMANAVNYTDSGYIHAKLHLERINGLLHLSMDVCDTGLGLSEEQQTLLFQDFSQVQQARPKDSRGTGLGLVICREMANLLGGDISLYSEVGRGSRFSLQLPIVIEPKSKLYEPLKGTQCLLLSNSDSWREHMTLQMTAWGASVKRVDLGELDDAFYSQQRQLFIVDFAAYDSTMAEQVSIQLKRLKSDVVLLVMSENRIISVDHLACPAAVLPQPSSRARLIETIQQLTGQDVRQENSHASDRAEPVVVAEQCSGNILVVDDSEGNRIIAEAFLTDQGYEVFEAADGLEAIEKIKAAPIDLILMDMRMPNMGGVDATKIIRQQHLADSVPIIALTAHALVEVREECLSVGMQDFLTKPIERERLLKTVGHWLKNREQNEPLKPAASLTLPATERVVFDDGVIHQLIRDTSEKAVSRMLDVFYHECQRRRALIHQAKVDNNLNDFSVSVHALKSSAKTFGALALSDVARNAEQACIDNHAEQAWLFIDSIDQHINTSLAAMASQLNRWWQPPKDEI